ncbi:MAG: HAD family hydrolase [Sulfobacillus sp.]
MNTVAIVVPVPGAEPISLHEAVFDYNGTLADGGLVSDEVVSLIGQLKGRLSVVMLSAGTFGGLDQASAQLGVGFQRVNSGADKAAYISGRPGVVAIGNGRNDVPMFRQAALAICVIGPEGAAREAMEAATVVVGSPEAAIRLLLDPRRLTATLRR